MASIYIYIYIYILLLSYLVLTNSDSDIIYGIPIKSKLLTDHFTITFRLKLFNKKRNALSLIIEILKH